MYRAARETLGTREVTLNSQKERYFPQIETLERNLKRVNRVMRTIHATKGKVTTTTAWKKLAKNLLEHRPQLARENITTELTEEQIKEVRVDAHRIQKKLAKQLKQTRDEEAQKRIAEYMQELEDKEQDDPKTFFKRANVYKTRSTKQLVEINEYNENGEITSTIKERDEVMVKTYTYWKVMFEAKATERSRRALV
jgi:hypothetical protein